MSFLFLCFFFKTNCLLIGIPLSIQQEKIQKAASKAEEAEKRKLDKEMQKRGKGKLPLKSIIAEIDLQLVEGALGGKTLSPFFGLFFPQGLPRD